MIEKRQLRWLASTVIAAAGLMGWSAVGFSQESPKLAVAPIEDEQETCNCYWDRDCGTGGDCTGYFQCKLSGKLDGTCKKPAADVEVLGKAAQRLRLEAEPEELAAAVDFYFQAYLSPARKGDGPADLRSFSRAKAIWLSSSNQTIHEVVQEAVHEALDTTIGFDFVYPQPLCVSRSQRGNLRAVPEAGAELIEAVRDGLVQGLLTRDATVIEQNLAGFWARHPDYHPNHTGRYYPHGHAGESSDPQALQREALGQILQRLLELL